MTPDRRTFLRTSALAGGMALVGGVRSKALGTGAMGSDDAPEASVTLERNRIDVGRAPRSLRILILGGTGFTGPFQVAYAVARGHQVTVLNRGRQETQLPAGVEALQGDRNTGELDALEGRSWDVVLDNPTTLPFWVRDVGVRLRERTGQYLFISTLSAYDLRGATTVDEDSPTLTYTQGDPLEVTPEQLQTSGGGLYGVMKAESEREALRWFGDRVTIVRPGLIVGPRDTTDRFTYWPVRISRGGAIAAPGDGFDPVQIIDGRDLAEWTIRLVEAGSTGRFNAVGPRSPLTMAEQLHGIRAALAGDFDLRWHWIPAEFLRAEGIRPWSEMTTWFGPRALLSQAGHTRALAAGLRFRPLAETVTDTLTWFRSLPEARQATMSAGLTPAREEALLEAWAARGASNPNANASG